MPRKPTAKATGVWEKEPGSGVWCIRYRAEGKLKREKVGRRSDAIDLYRDCGEEVHSPSTRSVRRARSKNAVKNFVSSSVERTSEQALRSFTPRIASIVVQAAARKS